MHLCFGFLVWPDYICRDERTLGGIYEIWAKSIPQEHFLWWKHFFMGVRKQAYPGTASPTPSRSPSVQRWGLTSHHTRPSGHLSPDRRWPGLSKRPGPRKCHKDHLRKEIWIIKVFSRVSYFIIHFCSITIILTETL